MMRSYVTITVLILLFAPSISSAQEPDFPRDTSYTFSSAFQKYVKQYPEITAPLPTLPGKVKEHRNLVFKNTRKRNLHLDVFSPAKIKTEKIPAVIMVHGGGWISGDRTLLYHLATHIAQEGFATVLVEYRLSPEAKYPAAVQDMKSAIKWIRDNSGNFNIDPDKIALLGTSAGGQIAALAGTTPDVEKFEDSVDTSRANVNIQAIADIDGVLAFIHPDSEEGTVASKWLGGDQTEARETWIEASPLTYMGEKTPPMLFIGSSNPRFLAGREEAVHILDSLNIYNKSHIFEDAPHSFWLFNPWFEPTLELVVEFLNRVLKS